jgi:hypothetical protein
MGWASGSQLAEELWHKLKILIPKKDHKKAATIIYNAFCDEDADDWSYEADSLWRLAAPANEVAAYDAEEADPRNRGE